MRFTTDKFFLREGWQQILLSWLRSIFLEDWATKAVALVIALGLWYGVMSRRAPTTRRIDNVRLVLQLPGETETSNEVQNRVDITVTGDKSRLERFSADEVIVVADLSGYKTDNELIVQLKPETVNVELPNGVKLDEIEPNKISVKLEPRIEKLISVKPTFTGQLPADYEVIETVVTPATVRVRGAASRVNALTEVPTEQIELLDKTGDFVANQMTINLLDPKITVLDAVVDVAVRVGERRAEKIIHNVKVAPTISNKSAEFAVVTISGARSILEQITADNLTIELDTDEAGAVSSKLVLPDELIGKVEVRSIKLNGNSNHK